MDFLAFEWRVAPSLSRIGRGDSIEARSVDQFFRGRRLSDVTLETLHSEYPHDPAACLVFMAAPAFAAYLPAFMRIALERYEDSGSIPEAVVHRLREMAEGRDEERRDEVVSKYSGAQLLAIAEFLSEMSRRYWHAYPDDEAKCALGYWHRVATERAD